MLSMVEIGKRIRGFIDEFRDVHPIIAGLGTATIVWGLGSRLVEGIDNSPVALVSRCGLVVISYISFFGASLGAASYQIRDENKSETQ